MRQTRKQFAALLLAAVLLLLAGCGGGQATAPGGGYAAENDSVSGAQNGMDFTGTEESPSEGDMDSPETVPGAAGDMGGSVYQKADAKLIRRAELAIQTTAFDDTVKALEKQVNDCGGYFESSTVYGGGYYDANARRSGEYVVRVPEEKYSVFLSAAGDLGYVTRRNETTEDVGEQYYDTEARLRTQRTKQERLQALLEKAELMEDIISIESALTEVEYEIEQLSSTLNRYDSLIGYSTIQIYLDEVRQITEEVGETSSLWQRMAAGFAASFRGLGDSAQDLLIWFSYNFMSLVLLCLVVCAAFFLIRGRVRKIRARRNPGKKKAGPDPGEITEKRDPME